jgi:polysaccharide biosynthesis protein PslJ
MVRRWSIHQREGLTALGVASVQPGDTVRFLTVWLVLLMVVPARLVIAPLGAAGAPALLLAVGGLFWWLNMNLMSGRILRPRPETTLILVAALVTAVLCSYVAAMTRPIDGLEVRAADRGLIKIVAWAAVVLLTVDGISTRDRLETLLRRFTVLGSIVAAIGVVQAFSGVDVTRYIIVPGLSANFEYATLLSRGGLNRPAGTATHPIEFGVVMAMVLPIALHFALHSEPGARLRRWIVVLLVGLAMALSVSRSAIVGEAVALLILFVGWPARRRIFALMLLPVLVVLVRLAVPGLVGTLVNLFTGISTDPSADSRISALPLAMSFVRAAPVFGRGFGTFLPSYVILDNQYLGFLIETGAVGLLILLAFLASGVWAGRAGALASPDAAGRDLGYSLAAASAVPLVTFVTFDALSFPMAAALAFFVVGSSAAFARIQKGRPAVIAAPGIRVFSAAALARLRARRPSTGSVERLPEPVEAADESTH